MSVLMRIDRFDDLVPVAQEIDGAVVVASLEDGIPNLTLPKRDSEGERRIKIQ